MTREREAFLDRWSRLKRETPGKPEKAEPPATAPGIPASAEAKAEAPPLPPVDQLRPDSDFTPFMNPAVDPQTRRAALKKLFTDAHFNIPDPYEAYSEDYTKSEPIPAQMLRAINRARDLAVKGPEKVAEEERLAEEKARAKAAPEESAADGADAPQEPKITGTPDDVAGRQDA